MNVTTFLMFDGRAEEAMNFYVSLFDGAKIISISRFDADQQGKVGSVKQGILELPGQRLIFFDSPVKHAFTFTPAISLFVTCDDEAQIDRLYAALPVDGQILMELNSYPFAKKFAWVSDRFGVSWQLNLP